MPLWLWLTVLVYLSGYIAINSLDFAAFKEVITSVQDLCFFQQRHACFYQMRTRIIRSIAYISLIFFIVWLTILGARTAGFSLLVVLLFLISWQRIVQKPDYFQEAVLGSVLCNPLDESHLHGGWHSAPWWYIDRCTFAFGLGLGFLKNKYGRVLRSGCMSQN